MKPFSAIFNLSAASIILATATGCIDNTLQNENFDAWCGDNLCLWETNEGAIKKVSTWHRQDFGAAFIKDPTIISQRVENGDTKCFLFAITANVSADAALYFELDYLSDDLYDPEFSKRIWAPDWNQVKLDVAVPSWCTEFRVILRKTGKGSVVVASVFDERYEECPLTVPDGERPAGMACESDDDCRSGLCEPPVESVDAGDASCGNCTDTENCETDQCVASDVFGGVCQ
jgi:hypothetical protein